MTLYLAIAAGGAGGAMLRYWMSGAVQGLTGASFPWGTLAVNVLGSLILGAFMQLSTERFLFSQGTRLLLTTGFCGGLTTFSTFSYETWMLVESHQWPAAAGNVMLNVLVCLAAVYLGLVLARLI
ncbi:MAG: fluoride efflux transporter CrcB [bacterium]